MAKKIVLLDSNVIVDYYLNRDRKVIESMDMLKARREQGQCIISIPNFCIGEVFSSFANICFYKDKDRLGDRYDPEAASKRFVEAKYKFIDELSRDYQYKRFQYFSHVELNRYHLFNAHLVYEPAWKHLKALHEKKMFTDKYPSTFDLLVIAQGIEMTSIYSDSEFALMTSDKLMIDICNYLRNNIKNPDKVKLVEKPPAGDASFKYLVNFRYPVIIDAKSKSDIVRFMGL